MKPRSSAQVSSPTLILPIPPQSGVPKQNSQASLIISWKRVEWRSDEQTIWSISFGQHLFSTYPFNRAGLIVWHKWSPLRSLEHMVRKRSKHRELFSSNPQIIRQHLLPKLQYSCHYRIHHLERRSALASRVENMLLFLQRHFLHWVEVMSLLGVLSDVVSMLDILQTYQ